MCHALRFFTAAAALLVAVSACSSSSTAPETNGVDPSSASTTSSGGPKEEPTPSSSTAMVIGIDGEAFSSQGFVIGQLEVTATVEGAPPVREVYTKGATPFFPRELRITPPAAKPEAEVDIEVVLRDSGGGAGAPPIVTRRAHAKFVKGKTSLAYVFLEIRCNTFPLMGGMVPSGPTCAAPLTCIGGTCEQADLGPLPDYRADWTTNPPSACGNGAPELDIAQGQSETDGDPTLTLERGPQCGHHIWIAVRMKGLAQSGTTTTLSAVQPGSGLTVPPTAYPYSYVARNGECSITGLRFQVDLAGAKVADFLGKPLDITVDASDRAGRKAKATKRVAIAPAVNVLPGPTCPE